MPVDDGLVSLATTALGVEVVSPLKQGGQKTVFRVKMGEEDLVLKVIAVGTSNPDGLRRAKREADLLRDIIHPNVVRMTSELVELGEDPGLGVAWTEEFLPGQDLIDLIGAEPWSWQDARQMGIEIARGLGQLHRKGYVHRDLSANNIRQVSEGRFVVMDPGYARHQQRSELTVGGQPGTPGYLSPEHVHAYSGGPTAASDVFCVGILMFLALTGRLPIEFGGDGAEYVRRLVNAEVADIAAARPDLPGEAVLVIRRCLHPQSARRYRNGQRLASALEQNS